MQVGGRFDGAEALLVEGATVFVREAQPSRACFQNKDKLDPVLQIFPQSWDLTQGVNTHDFEDAIADAAFAKDFEMPFRRPACLNAMVAQVLACPLDHVSRTPVLMVVAEISVGKEGQWALGHSYWCTEIQNFYNYMSFFFPQPDAFRHNTDAHSKRTTKRTWHA